MHTLFHNARAKILAVASWLRANARYQNQRITEAESIETATHFNNKLDIHDVQRHMFYDDDNDRIYYYTFRVKVGVPKFRGTVNYTLHPHSLCFNTNNPTQIRIKEDFVFPLWMDKISKAQLGDNHSFADQWINQNVYSGHPHINDYNEPCLGGWAQAWSACVATSNLPSLVPVAQSFLNTWTSNDAYYDINNLYRSYRWIPTRLKKTTSIAEFMSHTHLWYKLMKESSTRSTFSHYAFCRWVYENEAMVEELVFRHDISLMKLYSYFNGVKVNRAILSDTEDRQKKKMFEAMGILNKYVNAARAKVDDALGHPPDKMVEGLITESMIDKANLYCPKPWSTNPSDTWIGSQRLFYDYVDNQLHRERRNLESGSRGYQMKLDEMFNYARVAEKGERYRNTTFLNNEHIINAIHYFNSNVDKDYSKELFMAVNTILDSVGYGAHKVTFDSQYIESIQGALLALDNAQPTDEQIDEFTNTLTYKVLCNYESKLSETITKRIQYGKEKYRPVISNSSFRNDAQQSQLSLESF